MSERITPFAAGSAITLRRSIPPAQPAAFIFNGQGALAGARP